MTQIDWSTAEVVLCERDGCKLYGYIESALDMTGRELTDKELEEWEDEPEMYQLLFDTLL